MNRVCTIILLATVSFTATGCVGFSGPSDVRRDILRADHSIDLVKEQGVSVGPVGVAMATLFLGSHLPPGLNNVSSVDFGEYTISSLSSDGSDTFRLRDLELDKWEPIVRIREGGEEVAVMIGTEASVRRILVLVREGNTLNIVKAKGNFEQLVAKLMDSGSWNLAGGDFDMDFDSW